MLIRFEHCPYYVGLLKAAEMHGATHQAVMEFQVVTASVFNTLIARLPGEPWARIAEMTERFGIPCDPGTEIPS